MLMLPSLLVAVSSPMSVLDKSIWEFVSGFFPFVSVVVRSASPAANLLFEEIEPFAFN